MSKEPPKAIHEATLTIAGVDVETVLLDNGQRIFPGDGLARLFTQLLDSDEELSDEDAAKLASIKV